MPGSGWDLRLERRTMRRSSWAVTAAVVSVALAAGTGLAQRLRATGSGASLEPVGLHAQTTGQAAATKSKPAPAARQTNQNILLNLTVDGFCVDCHNDEEKKGNLTLESFDIAHTADHVERTEKMIRKLQAGMMPPPGVDRPDEATYAALIDGARSEGRCGAAAQPEPGRAHVPAAESRRVRARGQGTPRARRRRRHVAAARSR